MSILYKAVKRNSVLNPDMPEMYIAMAKSRSELTLDDLSKEIAFLSTVSRADVYAVLIALCETLPQALKNGHIVRLGSLGSFLITLQSEVAASPEELTANKVKRIRMRFRPSKAIIKELETYELKKI